VTIKSVPSSAEREVNLLLAFLPFGTLDGSCAEQTVSIEAEERMIAFSLNI
jgi:hypothetical protein